MGTLAAIQGDFPKAERYYLAALKAPPGMSDPNKSMAHYNLGKIYEKQHKTSRALQQYQRFLETVPLTYIGYKGEVEQRIRTLLAASPMEPTR